MAQDGAGLEPNQPVAVSSSTQGDSAASSSAPLLPAFCHRCFTCCGGMGTSPELSGFMLLKLLRAVQVAHSAVFFAPALQTAVRAYAGCPPLADDADACVDDSGKCNNRIFSGLLRQNSVIGTLASVSAFFAAVVAPTVGVFCDATPYRRAVGLVGAVVGALVMLAGVTLDSTEALLSLNLACVFIGYIAKDVVILMAHSYLPELSHDIREQARASGIGNAWLYGGELISIAVMLVLTTITGAKDNDIGRLSGGVFGTASLVLIPFTFSSLRAKPPRVGAADDEMQAPGCLGHVLGSFRRSVVVVRNCWRENRDYALLLLTALISDPALNGMVVLAAVFLSEEGCLTASQVSMALALAILCALPGAVVCGQFAQTVRAARNAEVGLLLTNAVWMSIFSAALPRGSFIVSALMSAVIGFLLGATWQAHAVMLAGTVTPSREAELSSVSILSYNLLQWVPPLLFVLMNEATGSMKAALALLVPFLLGGAVVVSFVNPARSQEHVSKMLSRRRIVVAEDAEDGSGI
ncbi:MFS transporter [Pycnococcus provasolii]